MFEKQKKRIYKFIVMISIFCLALLLQTGKAYASKITNIEGIVTNEDGTPAGGVTINCGSSTTKTNPEGRYSIWVQHANDTDEITLSFSGKKIVEASRKVASYDRIPSSITTVNTVLNIPGGYNKLSTIVTKKLEQLLKDEFGSQFTDVNTVTKYDDSIETVLEDSFTNVKMVYVKSIFSSYMPGSSVAAFNARMAEPGYQDPTQTFYDIYLIPSDSSTKSAIATNHMIQGVLDPFETDEISATDLLNAIYEESGIISKNPGRERNVTNIDDVNNSMDLQLEEDQVVNITIKEDASVVVPTVGDTGHVDVIAKITLDDSTTESFDENVEVWIRSSSGTEAKLGEITANLGEKTWNNKDLAEGDYDIIYRFTRDAWNQGYSTQEYEIINPTTEVKDKTDSYTSSITYEQEKQLDEFDKTKIEVVLGSYTVTKTDSTDADGNPIEIWSSIDSELQLKRRKKNEIQLTNEVNAIKVVLSDGSEFLKEVKDNGSLKWSIWDFYEENRRRIISMDDEIMHGATVYVEYKIQIENTGDIENTVIIDDYLDDKEGQYLLYDPNNMSITEPEGRNADTIWQSKDKTLLSGTLLDDSIKFEMNKNSINTIIETKIGDLKPHEKKEIRLITSQVITTDTDPDYQNKVHILKYENAEGKRNGTWDSSKGWDSYKRAGTEETRSVSGEVSILPPFGRNWFDLVKTKQLQLIYQNLW